MPARTWLVTPQPGCRSNSADNEPVRFWQYAITALQRINPEIGDLALNMLAASASPPVEVILTSLLNDLAGSGSSDRMLLVLDDYHEINTQAIHDGINFFLDHLPPGFALILTTRADPPMALARRRGRMEMVEIRAADLRFTREESMEFLNAVMKLGITPVDGDILLRRTEGWAAGLQMAALAINGMANIENPSAEDIHAFVASFAGDDQYIGDYLVEEVLDRQSAEVQQFLLQTSILERFNADLCASVLSGPRTGENLGSSSFPSLTPQTCRELLDKLDHSNLFLVPLDNRQEWFRYHRLFAELLQRRLRQAQGIETEIELHGRASRWFASNELWMEAFEHALQAKDPQSAALIIKSSTLYLFQNSLMTTLLDWVHRLPEDLVFAMPMLCMHWSWAAISTGHVEETVKVLNEIEKRLGINVQLLEADRETILAMPEGLLISLIVLAAQRSTIAVGGNEIADGMKVAQNILRCLSFLGGQEKYTVIYDYWAVAYFNLGLGYEAMGDAENASQAFVEAVAGSRKYNNLHILSLATSHLAILRFTSGRLVETADTYREALGAASEITGRPSPFVSVAHTGLAQLFYEWNRLEDAQQEYEESIAIGVPWNTWESLIPAAVGLARTRLALKDRRGALSALENLDALWQKTYRSGPLPIIQGWRVIITEANDQIPAVAASLDSPSEWMSKANLFYSREQQELLIIRLLILERSFDQALEKLESAIRDAKRGKQFGIQIYSLVLKVVVLQRLNRSEDALLELEQALELAQPGGYVRTFVDAGLPVAVLLYRLAQSEEHPLTARYARQLLEAFPADLLEGISPEEPKEPSAKFRPPVGCTAKTKRPGL